MSDAVKHEAVRHLEDYDTETTYQAVVVSSSRITPEASPEEVREIILDVDRDDFPYEVGQSIGVLAPGAKEFGKDHHFRLYSVAHPAEKNDAGKPRLRIAVRRCFYVDEFSGEQYPGVASNFLCDRKPGESVTLSGPYGLAFEIPQDPAPNLILIGTGTGIAPFRAFIKHLYAENSDWKGRVWLFYGARSGLELLYMNDEQDDLSQYYDRDTFEAFHALSPRPNWADPIAWDQAIGERGDELWKMMGDPATYVYVAGLEPMREQLDKVFAGLAGSPDVWARRKAELMAGKRWVELIY